MTYRIGLVTSVKSLAKRGYALNGIVLLLGVIGFIVSKNVFGEIASAGIGFLALLNFLIHQAILEELEPLNSKRKGTEP